MGAAVLPAGVAVAGGALSAEEEGAAGQAQSNYYSYLASAAKINEGLTDPEATAEKKQIGDQTNREQIDLTNRIAATVGAEKVSVVTGVGGSSRSAQDIISDTLNKGNLDEMSLRVNAFNKSKNADITAKSGAMNFASQAAGAVISGINALGAAKVAQTNSLIGAAGSVANSYYMGSMYAGRGYGGSGNIGSVA